MELLPHRQQPPIRTPDQRLRVFVSSTLKELAEERAAAREAIRQLRLAPVMFELGARPHAARDLYRAYLEQSHVFVGIYAEDYGWVAQGMDISGLEEEYRLAQGKPKLIYIRAPAPKRHPRLAELLAFVRDHDKVSYKYFSSAAELRELIEGDLALLLVEAFEASRNGYSISSPDGPHTLFPLPPTPIIGREREVVTLCDLLTQEVRLVTLTGPGGSGKTRLGIEVAQKLANQFESVIFVDLSVVTDPERLADAIAQALGIREAGAKAMTERLQDYLRDRHLLLVLDNFEQIVAAAPLVATLLKACPLIKMLVTSRIPLQLRGEREFPVPPLPLPENSLEASTERLTQNGAIQLFIQRATAVKPDFAVTADNAAAVADICRRLDGLPLAIELAAAHIRLLSPKMLLARLEQQLSLLQGGARDLPKRQQTMRNTIAWSYDLLNAEEASLFRRLSVFAGGWSLEAAEATGNHDGMLQMDALSVLEALVSKNLLRIRESPEGELRFDMLETIRDFAFERLVASGEATDIMECHAALFVKLAQEAEPQLTSGQRDPWLARLELEYNNLQAVLHRSLSRQLDPHYGVRLAGMLGWFWHLRGHLSEGRSWASSLLALPEAAGRTRTRAKLLFPAGGLAWSQGDHQTAVTLLEESAALFEEVGDMRGLTDARGILAGSLASLGTYGRALALCEEMAAQLRQTGDRWGLAFTLYWLGGIILVKTGDAQAAASIFTEILEISEALEDAWLRAEALDHLGIVAGLQKDYESAQDYFEKSLAYHKTIGDRWAIARGLSEYADTMLHMGDTATAKALFQEGMGIWHEMGNRLGLTACLWGLAQIAAAEGQSAQAARLYGAVAEPTRVVGWFFISEDSGYCEAAWTRVREALGEDAWQSEFAFGQTLPLEDVIAMINTGLADKATLGPD